MKKQTVLINSREYDLKFKPDVEGGIFWTYGEDGLGKGTIEIGLNYDQDTISVICLHEFIEAILVDDAKRFRSNSEDLSGPAVTFHFDHDYLVDLCFKIHRALISSGCFKFALPTEVKAPVEKKNKNKAKPKVKPNSKFKK